MSHKRVNLTEVAFFQEGPGIRNHQYTAKGIKLINVSNLQGGKLDLSTSHRYISEEEAYSRYSHFLVDEGDLIIASSGIKVDTFADKVGFAGKEHLPLMMNTGTIRFKTLDSKRLDLKYLMYYFKGHGFKKELARLVTGSAQLNFGPTHLRNIKIPLPRIEDQKQAIKLLDKANELVGKRQTQIELLNKFQKSVFNKFFGDLHDNRWEMYKLEQLSNLITDGVHQRPSYTQQGIPFISVKDISSGELDFSNCKHISPENHKKYSKKCNPQYMDILYTKIGTCGKPVLVDTHNEFSLYVSVCLIKPDKKLINSYYLAAALDSAFVKGQLRSKVKGIGVPDLHLNEIKNIDIPLPPLSLQEEYEKIAQKIKNHKKLLNMGLRELKQNFRALLEKVL